MTAAATSGRPVLVRLAGAALLAVLLALVVAAPASAASQITFAKVAAYAYDGQTGTSALARADPFGTHCELVVNQDGSLAIAPGWGYDCQSQLALAFAHSDGYRWAPNTTPARFIDSGGTIIDRASIRTTVSAQRQERHVVGDPLYNGGGYFRDASSAQNVLDAFHDGSAQILGVSRNGNVVVRVPSVTGFNNNPAAGYLDQATDVFFIKGSSSPSVAPTNPNWSP